MVCTDCGLVMADYGCPECGEWLCADCLEQHDARHVDASGMAAEVSQECWPDDEPVSEQEGGGDADAETALPR